MSTQTRPAIVPDDFEMLNLDDPADPADYIEVSAALRHLATYCDLRRVAARLRTIGKIDRAIVVESQADTVYRQLPEWARW